MTTAAKAAQGTLLKKGATTIVEVANITGPGLKRDMLDVTNQDSSSSYREFIAGLKDGGEVSFDINFQPAIATHQAILTDFGDGSSDAYSIVWSDGATTTWTFNAIVSGFEPEAAVDGHLVAHVTLKCTGAPTLP